MDKKLEKEIKVYLDKLRRSGIINMYGSVTILMDEFDMSKSEATQALLNWMKNFKEEDR